MDGDGDGEQAPPPLFPLLPSQPFSSFLFTPASLSLPSSPSMHPPPLHFPPPPPPQAQILGDFDWASLLSAPTLGLGEHYLGPETTTTTTTTSSVMAEEENGSSSSKDRRKGGGRSSSRKATRPRFAFQTRSVDDILDDGYRWRKYGQKAVKNSIYPRFHTHNLFSHFLLFSPATAWYSSLLPLMVRADMT